MRHLVIGAVLDVPWAIPLWTASIRANVNPAKTGLVCVVPANDHATREVLAEHTRGFDWVEVQRARDPRFGHEEPHENGYEARARARNQALQVVIRANPAFYLSWNPEILVPPRTVESAMNMDRPMIGVWTWLNRQAPNEIEFEGQPALWQEPLRASAMRWDRRKGATGRAYHYPPEAWDQLAQGLWPASVIQSWALMRPSAYRVARYEPHPDGSEIPFNWQLEQRGIGRWCLGNVHGLRIYEHEAASYRWPAIMSLASQQPLASTFKGERPDHWKAFGIFPERREQPRQEQTNAA